MNFLTLISPNYFQKALSGQELFVFAIISAGLIFLLSTFYRLISKKYTQPIKEESIPMYVYRDLLLQERNSNVERFPLTTKTSMSTKVIAFVLILFVITTPLYQLFKFDHFL
jgi:hypothetical protein